MAHSSNTSPAYVQAVIDWFYEINYWDTYSPVAQWVTVRLLLILAFVENLHTP